MANWILNFTKGGTKNKKQMPQQARNLFELGLWGVPATAQAKDKLAVGDRVIAYVGAPDRIFIGDATIAAPWHEWTPEESSRYAAAGTFTAGIALSNARIWEKPVPLASVWPKAEGASTNPNALWYGAVVRIAGSDFDLIARAGAAAARGRPLADTVDGVQSTDIASRTTVVAGANKGGQAGLPGRTAPSQETAKLGHDPTQSVGVSDGLPESSAVFKVVEQLRKFLDGSPKPLNEASTRAFFIDKCFDALGYSDIDDIEHGAVVQTGDFPDYVLRSDGKPVIAVEAKKFEHGLGPKEAGQVVKYCSVLGLRWGLLTNGRYLQVYDAPVTGVPPEERLVLEIDLNDWADREDFDLRRWPELAMLSKSAMATGDALERYAARELIRGLLTNPASATLQALRRELQQKKVVLGPDATASLVAELLS